MASAVAVCAQGGADDHRDVPPRRRWRNRRDGPRARTPCGPKGVRDASRLALVACSVTRGYGLRFSTISPPRVAAWGCYVEVVPEPIEVVAPLHASTDAPAGEVVGASPAGDDHSAARSVPCRPLVRRRGSKGRTEMPAYGGPYTPVDVRGSAAVTQHVLVRTTRVRHVGASASEETEVLNRDERALFDEDVERLKGSVAEWYSATSRLGGLPLGHGR